MTTCLGLDLLEWWNYTLIPDGEDLASLMITEVSPAIEEFFWEELFQKQLYDLMAENVGPLTGNFFWEKQQLRDSNEELSAPAADQQALFGQSFLITPAGDLGRLGYFHLAQEPQSTEMTVKLLGKGSPNCLLTGSFPLTQVSGIKYGVIVPRYLFD